MRPGPFVRSARDTLAVRNDFRRAGDLEAVEAVEIDCAEGVRLLMGRGSPMRRAALRQVTAST